MRCPDKLKLLIVDDHAVLREGLEAMLGANPLFETIATASSAEEAFRQCAEVHPHVILLDLRMPQVDGFSALEVIHDQWPESRVLVLSSGVSVSEIKLVRRKGAAGYISKSADGSTLISAIMTVAGGGHVFPEELQTPVPEVPALSPRELEVLRHLGRGLSSYELGLALGISSETVKSHIKSIFQKFAVTTRAEAVSRAFEMGLLVVER